MPTASSGQGERKTVALVGCGPSGMFFLHALATRRRQLERQCDAKGLAALPVVTCFEAADGPGGIWRSRPDTGGGNMYQGLWSNVPKELVEFSDYTFDEHFEGRNVPAYLPRSDMLEYMLRRTTSVDADLYNITSWDEERQRQHIVKFNSSVRRVVFNSMTEKFEVEWSPNALSQPKRKSGLEGDSSEESDDEPETAKDAVVIKDQFDYCIWAAGKHGKRRIPRHLLSLLRSGVPSLSDSDEEPKKPVPFKGTILHSSDMSEFDPAVRGKRVVLIGDAGSAECCALEAIKHDVKMVFMLSRSGYGDCVYTGSWPGYLNPKTSKVEPKVKVFVAMPYQVVQNGTGLKCAAMIWDEEEEEYEIDDETAPIVLYNIDTIIFCTGYLPNQDFLIPDLQFQSVYDDELYWTVPDDFKMRPNPLSPEIGDIRPSSELDLSGTIIPCVYDNALVSNPRMMYLVDLVSEFPLMELDVGAWQCLAYITGQSIIPEKEEMGKQIQKLMEEEMHIVYVRWSMDMNYFDAMDNLPYGHWMEDWSDPRARELFRQYSTHLIKELARKMKKASYFMDFGSKEALNELGEKYRQTLLHDFHARYGLRSDSADSEWQTFRDADASLFRSVHTEQVAAPLPCHWLDLDKKGELIKFSTKNFMAAERKGQNEESLQRKSSLTQGSSRKVCGPSVAVIGCGPSGMFFLHALATRRQRLAESNDLEGLASLPVVTCFEASDGPGGIWQSFSEEKQEEDSPNMYDELWSNTPWPLIEFSDYTFEEHFGGQDVPAYLPRADILDYIVKRTQKIDPNLFDGISGVDGKPMNTNEPEEEKKVHEDQHDGYESLPKHQTKFNTAIQRVNYNSTTGKFEVYYAPLKYDDTVSREDGVTMEQFDFCVWAAGQHGKPRIPRPLLRLLRRGGNAGFYDGYSDEEEAEEEVPFKGTILHSSHMHRFDSAVNGKRVVLIGGSGSAEDLALQAVKQNAEMVFILSRSGYGACMYTGSWPSGINPGTGKSEPKVKVHVALPYRVVQNGTGLKCSEVFWNEEEGVFETDSRATPITLENIDTVIFCTGYVSNQGFLSPELRFQRVEGDDGYLTSPHAFKMRPNVLTPDIGDVEPSHELNVSGNVIPGVYRNMLISNPQMMYITDLNSEYSLLELDVAAWLCLAYIMGDATIPSKDDMERIVQEETEEEMHIPLLRWSMDRNYFDALVHLPENHWSDDWQDPRSKELNEQYARYFTGVLARKMRIAKYPVDFGTHDKLSALGENFVKVQMGNIHARHCLDVKSPSASWRTFRDTDPGFFCSIYSGQASGALPCPWLQMDRNGKPTTVSEEKHIE